MTGVLETTPPKSLNPPECEYLLKELEIQTSIEERARDRAESMMNYLLTTIAAIIGAVLLVMEIKANGLMVVSIGILLLYLFSVTAFYRLCRLCFIISKTKHACLLIRERLQTYKAMVPPFLLKSSREKTGFYRTMVINLKILIFACSILGALTFIFGYALLKATFYWLQISITNNIPYYIMSGVAGFAGTFTWLWVILKNYREWADELSDISQSAEVN